MSNFENEQLSAWRIIDSEDVLTTPYFVIKKHACQKPGDDLASDFYVLEARDSVMCVCITPEGLVLMERQYRLTQKSVTLDFPAGSVEPADDDLEQAALRELREETGYSSPGADHILTLLKDPGVSSSKMHVFLASNARLLERPKEDEAVMVELMEPKKILESVKTGEMSCALCVAAALYVAKLLDW